MEKAYSRKVQGAAEACRQQGLAFVPLAMEALGGLHKVTVAQVKMLAAALARQTGQEGGRLKDTSSRGYLSVSCAGMLPCWSAGVLMVTTQQGKWMELHRFDTI